MRDKGTLRLNAFDAGPPQGTALDLGQQDNGAAEALHRLRPSRLEITDPNVSPGLLELARRLELPIDLWITAAESLSHVDAVSRVLAPTETADAFARTKLPNRQLLLRPWPAKRLFITEPGSGSSVLAIIPGSPSARVWQSIRALAIRFERLSEPMQIVVAGPTADDQALMAFPNIFVTGAIEPEELSDLLALYDPGWLLTDFEQPTFGHPMIEMTRTANRPVAFRDWSSGGLRSRNQDLAIPPGADDTSLAEAVAQWVSRS